MREGPSEDIISYVLRSGVVVWDVLSDILRAMQGQEEGKKAESDREEEVLLGECYCENGFAQGGLKE